jgi:hypothetical protein
MRGFFLTLLAVGGFGMAGAAPATAGGARFCIQGSDYPGWDYCTYSSYEQCQATASGTDNECLANPWYAASDSVAPASANPPGPDGPIAVGPPPE